jgi:TRAP-type C4-dicarboxylate transport system permease small subunit
MFLSMVWAAILLWKTSGRAWDSLVGNFHSEGNGFWLFPVYLFMPIGSAMLLLICCTKMIRNFKD